MKGYKEYLELNKLGLIDLTNLFRDYIQQKLNLEVYIFAKYNLGLNINLSNIFIFRIKHDICLIVYLLGEVPKFLLVEISLKDPYEQPSKANLLVDAIIIPKMYNKVFPTADVSTLDFFKIDSDYVQNYALDLHLLDNPDLQNFLHYY